ncbi:uroporphyrinogen-III synthase [Allonocardiopsis opalescens]|nr:uroporphyrinogen-III synthase [Allonocardiopsis opalescens]
MDQAPATDSDAGRDAAEAASAGTGAREDRWRSGGVWLVGIGPGDDELLTLRAVRALRGADLVLTQREVASERLAGYREPVLRHCAAEAEIVDTGEIGREEAERLAVAAAGEGRRVVRLYSGDPFFFCDGAGLAAACRAAGVPVEVVPGVPAATAVAAYAGIPLSAASGEVRVLDAGDGTVDWERAGSGTATLVVFFAEPVLDDLAKRVQAAGRPAETPVAVVQMGTTTEQTTLVSTLGAVASESRKVGVSGPALVIVGEAVARRDELSWFESKPLYGWRVLVPRTKEQAAGLSEQLRSYGAVPEEVPTISVEPPRTPQQMERAVRGLVTGRYQWVAFTSVNAVRAIRERFEEYGLDARAFAGVKVAAVGEQTAAALAAFGIRADLVPDGEQSSEGLLRVWPPYDAELDPIERVLLPRADIATETLAAGLGKLGWEVDDITAYRTVRAAPPPAPIREAIKGGGFDAVLFTSSSTVRNLVGIAGKPHNVTTIAVIGPQTAKTAEEYGLRVDVRAPRASVAELAAALAEFGAEHRRRQVEAGQAVRRPSQMRRGRRKTT